MVLPYLKGLIIIKCDFAYCSCISIVVQFCIHLYWFLTSGIRALSLAGVVGKYFLFLQIFFSEQKKEGRDIIEVFGIFQ
jgi:hypothetical protein